MARPRAFTQEQIATALQETKGMVTVAARRLGCSANTIRAYAERYPNTVGRTLADERAMMTDVAELALFKAIQGGELGAIIFYLKTQGKDRGYIERQEISGPNAGPIQTEDVGLSDTDRATRILAIVQRARERADRAIGPAEPDLGAAAGPTD